MRLDVGDTDADGDKDIVITRTGDGTGIEFHQGYYVQLVENTGDREFRDVTSSLVPENRDDQAGSIRVAAHLRCRRRRRGSGGSAEVFQSLGSAASAMASHDRLGPVE